MTEIKALTKMKKAVLILAGIVIVFIVLAKTNTMPAEKSLVLKNKNVQQTIKDGDIIFQTSQSPQCEAVRIATNSKFSHCGIIYDIKGEKYVYEAVQPVKITPFKQWITHGENNSYLVKRLKNADAVLKPEVLEKMKSYGSQFKNRDYDLYFEWTDNKIYCSELVWKIYKNAAGIELCPLASLKDFNLSDKRVRAILNERYGNTIPLEEKVVAPSQLANSPLLETVIDTY